MKLVDGIVPTDQYDHSLVCQTMDKIRHLCGDHEIGDISIQDFTDQVISAVVDMEMTIGE